MKRTLLILSALCIAMLSAMTGCKKTEGNRQCSDSTTVESTAAKPENTAEGEPALYFTYTNQKYGFSVLVPIQMKCTDGAPMAEGANYAIEGDEGVNMMSVIASDNYGGRTFTPDDIKGELDSRAAELGEESGTRVSKTEAADGWSITVEGGELNHQVYMAKYKAGRRYELTYIYDKGHSIVLGNSVEADVMKSMTIK